jgi:hypothetical protein
VFVVAIDVGSPTKLGWACTGGLSGSGLDVATALAMAATRLSDGQPVALGFEAPIWTPRRSTFSRYTSSRQGFELSERRAWTATAGACALATGLGLMPWCFTEIARETNARLATTDLETFRSRQSGLFVWEAFVSGGAKAASHVGDAVLALQAFESSGLNRPSDVPGEPAVNLAAAALFASGWNIDPVEIGTPGHVVAVRAGEFGRSPTSHPI